MQEKQEAGHRVQWSLCSGLPSSECPGLLASRARAKQIRIDPSSPVNNSLPAKRYVGFCRIKNGSTNKALPASPIGIGPLTKREASNKSALLSMIQ